MNKIIYKKFILIIILGVISIFCVNSYLNHFDKKKFKQEKLEYSSFFHEDSILYIKESEKIRLDIENGKNFFESGGLYRFSYFYPKLIYFFNKILNNNSPIIVEDRVELNNFKILIFLQFSIFVSSILFFYKIFKNILGVNLTVTLVLLLFINPLFFQWHLSFLTESIFLSLLLITIALVIKSSKNIHFIFLGLVIGFLYMFRTVALLYPLIPISYLILNEKKYICVIKKSFLIIFGFLVILLIIGINNYTRSNIFYVTPVQSKTDINTYLETKIIKKSNNVSDYKARELLNKEKEKILLQNNFDLKKEKDLIDFYEKIKKNSIHRILNNKFIFLKIISKNYFHTLLLNPFQAYNSSQYQNWQDFKNSSDHKKFMILRVTFSFIFYLMIIIGLINSREFISKQINFLIIMSILYFFFTSCWLNNTRYFIPSALLMSFYLPFAINYFFKKVKKRN